MSSVLLLFYGPYTLSSFERYIEKVTRLVLLSKQVDTARYSWTTSSLSLLSRQVDITRYNRTIAGLSLLSRQVD